jgi:hypothetical protein
MIIDEVAKPALFQEIQKKIRELVSEEKKNQAEMEKLFSGYTHNAFDASINQLKTEVMSWKYKPTLVRRVPLQTWDSLRRIFCLILSKFDVSTGVYQILISKSYRIQ